ncbi:MAG: SRPBCC domain-containing protein [Phycisphaerales bacterium]|mgnify:CR=1 FL=1
MSVDQGTTQGTTTDRKHSVFRTHIKASIHDVWTEITRTDAPIAAFFNARMHTPMLEAGSKLAMRTPDGKYTGVVGEILEVIPPTKFSHTFKFTNFDDPPCTVTYELREIDGGTEFTLTVIDAPPGTKTEKQMNTGGKMIVNTLKRVMETGRPSVGIRVLYTMFKIMPQPKRCRSEHWPVD